jgi:hypothetical protein
MRPHIALMALLLPLSGCVVPPDQAGYGYPGYPGYAPGYPQPGYPGAYPAPDYGYPGYSYYDGSPTLAVDGAVLPLIFYGGGWGYWDSGHNWHHAPDNVAHNLNQRYPGGAGFHAWGGSPGGRPPGGPPPGGRPPGGGFPGRPPGVTPSAAHAPAPAAVSHAAPPAGHSKDEHH